MKKSPDTLKLLVQLDMRHAASREMVGGVLRFGAAHRNLEVQFSSHEDVDYYRAWKPDGLITDSGCQAYAVEDFTTLAGRAVVYVNTRPRNDYRRPYATITSDDRELAVAAAKLFGSKRLDNFAYVGMPTNDRWSEARGRFFQAALKQVGKSRINFSAPTGADWRDQERALIEWLRLLPKPCGIFAACDVRAKQVLDACRLAGIAVPEQVQVLGVDDEHFICEQTLPSLSSLAPDFEAGGFAAAEYVYDVLTGTNRVRGKTTLEFGLRGTVERLSTSDINGTARRVAAAREYIRQHATAGVSVPDVALSLGVSVRLLEKNYRTVTGRTVLQDLQSARLAKVREMLLKTTMPIDNIGPFCGFNAPAHLKTLFKRTYGMTMREYREGGR